MGVDQDQINQDATLDAQPASDMDSKGRRRFTYAATFLSFFVGYVVSSGPAVFVARQINLPALTSIIEGLYFPLVLIVKLNVPLISPLIQAWVRLFR